MNENDLRNKLADLERRLTALEKLKKRETGADNPYLTPESIAGLSPRTQALRITAHLDKPHFIGKMSKEAINAELAALQGGYDDSVLTASEKAKRDKRIAELKNALKGSS